MRARHLVIHIYAEGMGIFSSRRILCFNVINDRTIEERHRDNNPVVRVKDDVRRSCCPTFLARIPAWMV